MIFGDSSPRYWAEAWRRAQETRPMIYTLTNFVAAPFQANMTLAAGGSPLMSRCLSEAEELAGRADFIVINTGTPGPSDGELFRKVLSSGKPWLLDPVGYGASFFRRDLVDGLIRDFHPTLLKGNSGEISLMAGVSGEMKGVDSSGKSSSLREAVEYLASPGRTVCATGRVDLISDGRKTAFITGGSPLLAAVTGGGCALGSLMAVLAAGAEFPAAGAEAALVLYRLAAQRAEKISRGPGTFQACFLDCIWRTRPGDFLEEGKRIAEEEKENECRS